MDEEKRAALLARRAERDEAAAKAAAAHADLLLELEDKYATELGPRGVAFEIVNEDNACGEGPIVLKTPEPTAHKRYMSSPNPTPMEDQHKYVRPSVLYPEGVAFDALALRRQVLLQRCVRALEQLVGLQSRIVGKGL